MTLDNQWYEVVQGADLMQGDVLIDCPVPCITDYPIQTDPEKEPLIDRFYSDVIVLTQSCDLANDKIEQVLLCELVDWQTYSKQPGCSESKKFREKIARGERPAFWLIRAHDFHPEMAWSVVAFRNLYLAPKGPLANAAKNSGDRLRLRSPYREHLAQAFGFFYMRIATDDNFSDFVREPH